VARDSDKLDLRARVLLGVVGVGLVGLMAAGIHALVKGAKSPPGRQVQVVQIIRPPPPPPEEPPPPPPEKVDEPLPQEQPEPSPSNDASPSEQLGLDAEGGAGGDAFGLAARKGGHDLVGTGGAVFAWYTQQLKDIIVDRFAADRELRAKRFSIVVRVWVGADGQVQNARLASSSGSREIDGAIEAALGRLGRLREPPPIEMPQPISLRIVSHS